MSGNLKQRIRTVVADQRAETGAEGVSESTVKAVFSGNAGVEPHDVEAALDDLVADGALERTDEGYRPTDDADER